MSCVCRAKTDINLAENSILSYIAKFYEKDLEAVKELYREKGDLGEVAAECLLNTPYIMKLYKEPLSVKEVMELIYKIKSIEGTDSYAKKYHLFATIMKTNDPVAVKFLVKVLLGTLRIGVSSKSLIQSVLQLDKDDQEYLDFIFQIERDVFGYTIRNKPEELHVNIPVSSMLGRAAKNYSDLEKLIVKNK